MSEKPEILLAWPKCGKVAEMFQTTPVGISFNYNSFLTLWERGAHTFVGECFSHNIH